MRRTHLLSALALAANLTAFPNTGLSESIGNEMCEAGKHRLLPAPLADKPGRKYARDRLIDVQHLALDVTPNFRTRTVAGTCRIQFTPIAKPLAELTLDAVDLTVEDIHVEGATLADRQSTEEKLILTFAQPVAPGTAASVTVRYRAQPERGLYFRTPEMGYPATDEQVWSQGEAEQHRFWFPCYDYPNERFTSEITCHVPEGMEVVSNGSLLGKDRDAAGLVAWHWKQAQPHVNYLIALAAGRFHRIDDKIGNLPLAMLVPASRAPQAAAAFTDTRAVIDFFQREIGVPFPWDKYYQVYCHDFVAGGMENTSCSFMAESLLFADDTEQLHTVRGLDAHEAAHQWFGDLVTCRDWAHLWLNEGFASYYTCLFEGEKLGPDGLKISLWKEAQRVLGAVAGGDTKPIVWRDYTDPMFQFDYRAYPKGAWVLHMLRSQLGADLYRKAIKSYLESHRGGIVTTDDLQQALEDVTGLSFDRFFDQWVFHGGVPEINVSYSWDAGAKIAKLTVRQTQKVSDQVPLFQFPLPLRFFTKAGDGAAGTVVDRTVEIARAEEDFYIPLAAQPELLRVDPDYTVLARVSFTPPNEMLKRQLDSDVIGRLLAVKLLADRKDDDAVKMLAGVLAGDASHAVRQEAIDALRKIDTPPARRALVEAPSQQDARVRLALVGALDERIEPEAAAALSAMAAQERNPEVLGRIVAAMADQPGTDVRQWLGHTSFRDDVATSVIEALRARDERSAVDAVIARLKAQTPGFSSRDLGQALDTVAFLARRQPDRSGPLAFLTGYLQDPRETVRTSAARALGTLGDARARSVLAPLTTLSRPFIDPVRDAADKALAKLDSEDSSTGEVQSLLRKMQELQRRTDELQQKLEKLEKRPLAPAAADEKAK